MHCILTYCSASVRKSVQRLDYISPEGSSGQESLVKRSRESKATCKTAERSDWVTWVTAEIKSRIRATALIRKVTPIIASTILQQEIKMEPRVSATNAGFGNP